MPDDAEIDSAVGLEGEVLGIDPITSLLDDVVESYARNGRQPELAPIILCGEDSLDRSGIHGAAIAPTADPTIR